MSRLAVLLVPALIVGLAGCLDAKKSTGQAGAVAKAVMGREEFKKAVMGKTAAEVLAAVGKPDQTDEGSTTSWYYRDRTVDPVTGKTDALTQVNFDKGGRVEDVRN